MPNDYEPTSARIAREAGELKDGLRELLLERSTLTRNPNPNTGSVVFVGFPTSGWGPLDEEGRALQAALLRRHAQFSRFVVAMLRDAPESTRKSLASDEETVREVIEQHEGSYSDTAEQAYEYARKSLEERVALVEAMFDPTPGQLVIVPDANAVVWNHDLDEWQFPPAKRFTVVLTSTLLGELDDLKMRHRVDRVRQAAEAAINQIKEYMGRGDIHGAGVTLRRDRSVVRMTAPEPDFSATLPWLDATSKDDRLLASVLEIVREHPHSPVVLVTLDANMLNKAAYAGISFVEPPEPAERPAPKKKAADVRIVRFSDGDGSEQAVSFRVEVQNLEARPVQAVVSASIDGVTVPVHPEELNLLANALPTTVSVQVPRPARADLVKAFNHEATLYGGTLEVVVSVDGVQAASRTWSEVIYSADDNLARHDIQRRLWRTARGEGTDDDHRADAIQPMLDRRDNE